MNEGRRQRWRWAGRSAGSVLGMALAAVSVAAPPEGRESAIAADRHVGGSPLARLSEYAMRSNGSIRSNDAIQWSEAMHSSDRADLPTLDLRAPAVWGAASGVDGEAHETPVAEVGAATRSDFTQVDLSRPRLDDRSASAWAALSAEGPVVRPMSRLERMADRFRHEGVPIAKLFESHSALVSLGLNQRGKPGLWLIQKVP